MTAKNLAQAEARRRREQAVAELSAQGFTVPEIADRIRVAVRTVTRDRAKLGLSQPIAEDQGKPISEERLARVRQMIADGASHQEIRRTLNVSTQTLAKYFPGTSWTQAQGVEFREAMRVVRSAKVSR